MATVSESPDPEKYRHDSDLYTRPGWVNATVALGQIEQGKATGDQGVLWLRSRLQHQLKALGSFVDVHAGKVLFVSLLIIATFSVGLKSATFHTDIEALWSEPPSPEEVQPQEILSTHQMLIQTAQDPDANLLHAHGLLEHLRLLARATQVTVNMFEITWKLKDICQFADAPNAQVYYVEQLFENILPCSIVTPLDCFWEGSKLLGPDFPVSIPYLGDGKSVKWTNLNPIEMVKQIKSKKQAMFDYHTFEDYMKRAGITKGYQEKPCLNASDPDCPITSPNYNSSQPLDLGAEITNGCYGFATKYMHWPEDLIVGGVSKNKTGHIKQAKALQTVVQLMGEHELFEFYSGTYKVHHIVWTQEKASMLLHAWQKRFAQEVRNYMKANASASYTFSTFSTATLNKGLAEHSKTDFIKLGIVLAVIVIYAWVVQSGMAALGVVFLASSTAAGLGVCSLLGLPMNILSTHVLPFISVGLAIRDIFLMLTTQMRDVSPTEVLQRVGPNILISSVTNAACFLAAALIPVPALRIFCMQAAILVVFHTAATLLVFPAILALELRCQKSGMPCSIIEQKSLNNNIDPEAGATNLLTAEFICQKKKTFMVWLVNNYLASFILNPLMKVTLCLTYIVLIIFCIFNGLKLEYDVRLSTFLPKNTQEYKYLEAQNKFFGFYNFYLVTTELEYPFSQPLLHEYHSSLTKVPNILKDSNGGLNLNDFWLANFREYLIDLQNEFDENRKNYCLNSETWFANATEKAVLAFKLLSQTGIVEFPVDKMQIFKNRLVENGIIDPKAFYNYLSVWNSNDQMSYSSSQANLTPKPSQYYSSKAELDLKIPKSQPLVYTQMPFYLKNLKTTEKIVDTLKQIRAISDEYNQRGLKNYPVGLIFAYFNQFLMLDRIFAAQLGLTLLAYFAATCILIQWTKLWCPLFSLSTCLLLMCMMNINAMSGTMGAILFILIGRNIVLVFTGYLSALGSREKRLRMLLQINAEPIIKGDIGMVISVLVLMTSQFEFIQTYIFATVLLAIGASIVNSFVLLPLILALAGPKGELQTLEHQERISTPPPPAPPPQPKKEPVYTRARRGTQAKAQREPSLTTITEESCNQSIVVEPQVTVEYSSPESSSSGPYTTKVTATANIKVELVAPVYRPKCGKCHRKCKSRKQTCKCCNKDSDSESSTEQEPCTNS